MNHRFLSVILALTVLLLLPQLSTATVYYAYGCEDNTIGNSNFSVNGISCVANTSMNGSYIIKVAGGASYASLPLGPLSLPANYNISFWIWGSSTTVPAGNPSGVCDANSNVTSGCYGSGAGTGPGFRDTQDPNYYMFLSGNSAGGNIGSIQYFRIQQTGGNMTLYRDTTQVESATKTGAYLQLLTTTAYDFYVDNICIWTGDETGCYPAAPATVNTITLSLNNSVNGTIWTNTTTFSNVTGSLTFTFFNITKNGFCVTLSGNGTQTNCTAGSGSSTYFNTTVSSSVSGTTSVTGTTAQGYIDLTAYQLYTNNSITIFNATNSLYRNATTGGTARVHANNGSNNIQVQSPGNYSRNVTCTLSSPLSTISCQADGIYDNQFTIGAKNASNSAGLSSFSVTAENSILGISNATTTTTGGVRFNLLQGYDYLFLMNATSFAYANITLAANASTNLYNFTLLSTNTINITFRDEITNAKINWTTVYFEYIGDSRSGNLTTTNGGLELNVVIPGSYTLRYTALEYPERFYEFTVNDGTFSYLNLTLLNSSEAGYTNVTVTVKDTLDNYLEGATIKLLKYDVATNSYLVQQIADANFEGQVRFNLLAEREYYKFVVVYEGTTVLTTSPTYVYGNSLTLIVDLTTGGGFERSRTNSNFAGNITTISGYDYVRFNYDDTSNTASQGCVQVYRITQTGRSLYNSTCTSSSSGTAMVAVNNATGNNYYAEGTMTDSGGVTHLVASLGFSYDDPIPESDGESLVLMFFVMSLLATLGVWKIEVGIILSSIVPLLFSLMGLSQIGLIVAVPVFVLGLAAAYIVAVK